MTTLTYETLDAVPEGLRENAAEVDGKYSVKVAPAEKVTEFRDRNISLQQQKDTLLGSLSKVSEISGVKLLDPEKEGELPKFDVDGFTKSFKALTTTSKRVKDGELIENTSLEEALAERTRGMREENETQIAALKNEVNAHKERATQSDSKLRQRILSEQVTRVALNPDSGIRPEAISDVLARASSVFEVKDDESLLPKDPASGKTMYGANADQPMTLTEWVDTLKKSAPHYFKASVGGGAGSDTSSGRVSPEQIGNMSPEAYRKARQEGRI